MTEKVAIIAPPSFLDILVPFSKDNPLRLCHPGTVFDSFMEALLALETF
jgi:hypothetical protein